MSEYETEKLIGLIKANPCLYDHRDKYNKHNSKKEAIWEQIAKEMNQTIDVVRTKWKGLKDGYSKYKKNMGCPRNKKKSYANWLWGPYLDFLDGARLTRQVNLLNSPNNSENNTECVFQSIDVDECEYNSSNQSSKPQSSRKRRASSEIDTTEVPLDKILGHLMKEKKDSTDLLFASYAKTMKMLKPRTQAAVKIKLSQIFAEAELEDLESSSGNILPMRLDDIKQSNDSDSD